MSQDFSYCLKNNRRKAQLPKHSEGEVSDVAASLCRHESAPPDCTGSASEEDDFQSDHGQWPRGTHACPVIKGIKGSQ